MSSAGSSEVRINKFLASCGVASRRKAEQLVEQGRVTLNGTVVTDLSTRVGRDDSVKLDGRRVRPASELTLLFYKPRGYLCTRKDTHDRKTIYDLLPPKYHRLTYVGRLDKESEGLLLLTSSGELVERLTHPRHEIEKEYHLETDRPVEPSVAEKWTEGVVTPEGLASAARVETLGGTRTSVVLCQGLKRQIRLMCAKFDLEVKRLSRVRIGELVAPGLEPGAWVELDDEGLKLVQQNPPVR